MENVGVLISAKIIPARKDKSTGQDKPPIGLVQVCFGHDLGAQPTDIWLSAELMPRVMRCSKYDEVVVQYDVQQYRNQPQLRPVAVTPIAVSA